jgi:hypothetical protein
MSTPKAGSEQRQAPSNPDPKSEIRLELQSQDHTEVYASLGGYVVIKQTKEMGEEVLVSVRPDDIDRLIAMLKQTEAPARENLSEYRKCIELAPSA